MKLRNQSCQLILGHYKISPYGCKNFLLWGEKFPLLELKFFPMEFFPQRLGICHNCLVLLPRLRAAYTF